MSQHIALVKGDDNVEIGNWTGIGENILIVTDPEREGDHAEKTYIGNDCYIGNNVLIRKGVTISDGSFISHNCEINNDCPPFSIWKVNEDGETVQCGYRYCEEVIEFLLKICWWNWNEEKLQNNRWIFTEPLHKYNTINQKLSCSQHCLTNLQEMYENITSCK